MASSGSANEDFQSRVDRIFGSLAFSRSPTPSAPAASRHQSGPVWSLSDSEVEKREWKREQLASYDRDEMPCAASFDDLLRQRSAQKPLEGEDDGGEVATEDFDDDSWSIRASMGLDRTLDDEAEEDEYDKVAIGKEDAGKGLYMKDGLSLSSVGRVRDPRANYLAAQIRLKEDELEARKISGSGDKPSESKEPTQSEESCKTVPPKPILKRKENSSDSEARSSKRVRFDCVSEEAPKKPEDTCSASASIKSGSSQGRSGAQVPDFLLNPSKYTCDSFDSTCETNERSSTKEYMDIPKAVEGLENSESESLKKVSFIPQKKTTDVNEDSSDGSETKPVVAIQVAGDEGTSATEDGDTEMGESESCLQRNGCQYRAKQGLDETDV